MVRPETEILIRIDFELYQTMVLESPEASNICYENARALAWTIHKDEIWLEERTEEVQYRVDTQRANAAEMLEEIIKQQGSDSAC